MNASSTVRTGTGPVRRPSEVWRLLESVHDPEIPVLSIVELGIVRYVALREDGRVEVGLTPTYSGCPATDVIRASVRDVLAKAGHADAVIREVLSPPWTSDWITEEGRRKLREFGIAPPADSVSSPRALLGSAAVACPRCGSTQTERVSEFGSTPCKAHYRCTSCLEPFDYFKCI
jgi:phenylacetate-CoA oxygenase, PaaJ subunit|nr:MAG: phenylacetate-CoA oxygenase subunit PaaJ [Pseudomonadota bacterium]